MNAQAEQIKPEKAEPAKGRKVNLPLRLSPEVHDSLRRIAFERRISLHSLLMEGVADILRRHGG
jgi:predicted HicB family RNase H-like nuclease